MHPGNSGDVIGTRNQDLLRASTLALNKAAISQALRWLDGEAAYPFPTSIHFDLTLRCTARCLHCKQWTWPDREALDSEQIERLFGIFSAWGVRSVTLGGGNPLLSPHLAQIFALARNNNIEIGIISEGIELSDDLAALLRDSARWVRFSLDGPSADIHDAIRNTPGLFDRVVGAIRRLKEHPSALTLGLNCVIQRRNGEHLDAMLALARTLEVDILLFKLPHGVDPGHRYVPTAEEWRDTVRWIRSTAADPARCVRTNLADLAALIGPVFHEGDLADGRPARSFYTENDVRCFTPLFFLACDSQGNMYPCDYLQADTRPWGGRYGRMRDEFRLGNVLEDSEGVLTNLASMLRRRIHGLPASGYDECGSCTRFCQMNGSLSAIWNAVRGLPRTPDAIEAFLESLPPGPAETPFL